MYNVLAAFQTPFDCEYLEYCKYEQGTIGLAPTCALHKLVDDDCLPRLTDIVLQYR